MSKKAVASSLKLFKRAASTTLRYLPYETKKYKPRHPGPRGSGELGEDHHNQQFYLAGYKPRHPGPRGSGELGEDHHNQQFYLAG